jgi:SOS response regulatory protein OraA/RecX
MPPPSFSSPAVEQLAAHASRLLAARPHSRHELEVRLVRLCERRGSAAAKRASTRLLFSGVNDCRAAAREALDALETSGIHAGDAAFAGFWQGQRAAFRPRSLHELRRELLVEKGVAAGDAGQALGRHDEEAACARAALRKPSADDAKLQAYLLRRGFQVGAVRAVLRVRREGGAGALHEAAEAAAEEALGDRSGEYESGGSRSGREPLR